MDSNSSLCLPFKFIFYRGRCYPTLEERTKMRSSSDASPQLFKGLNSHSASIAVCNIYMFADCQCTSIKYLFIFTWNNYLCYLGSANIFPCLSFNICELIITLLNGNISFLSEFRCFMYIYIVSMDTYTACLMYNSKGQ